MMAGTETSYKKEQLNQEIDFIELAFQRDLPSYFSRHSLEKASGK